ncbi:MAG: hypothetical protein JXN64_07990 [Spirochaetes bacterium]|nr:hypothetical protein [Spirochaetota bacterium]
MNKNDIIYVVSDRTLPELRKTGCFLRRSGRDIILFAHLWHNLKPVKSNK